MPPATPPSNQIDFANELNNPSNTINGKKSKKLFNIIIFKQNKIEN